MDWQIWGCGARWSRCGSSTSVSRDLDRAAEARARGDPGVDILARAAAVPGFPDLLRFGPRRIERNRNKRRVSYKAVSEAFEARESLEAADSPRDLSVQLTEMIKRATACP